MNLLYTLLIFFSPLNNERIKRQRSNYDINNNLISRQVKLQQLHLKYVTIYIIPPFELHVIFILNIELLNFYT